MVEKFEFGKNLLELEKHGKKMQEYAKIAEKRAEEVGNAKAMEEMIQVCIEAIDIMLGEGATNKIFKDRKINFFDCIDIINFVTSEIQKKRNDKMQQYSPNRAQRRAKK